MTIQAKDVVYLYKGIKNWVGRWKSGFDLSKTQKESDLFSYWMCLENLHFLDVESLMLS